MRAFVKMLPNQSFLTASAAARQPSGKTSLLSGSSNYPEENDEITGEASSCLSVAGRNSHRLQTLSSTDSRLDRCHPHLPQDHVRLGYGPYQPPLGLPLGYGPLTPFPSQTDYSLETQKSAYVHPSFVTGSSLPTCLSSAAYSLPSQFSYAQVKSHSLPSTTSLEQPYSLRSMPPGSEAIHHYTHPPHHPYAPLGPGCCTQWPQEDYMMGPLPYHCPMPRYHQPFGLPGPAPCSCPGTGFTQSGFNSPCPRQKIIPLSLEQRKVFVTYEADNDNHVNEIIKFGALLRHNGFDMHIDVFEQHFRSISKIDFMEKYISEKDYLIIIAISPKYYETVTGARPNMENDERTLNTVYIHKQLQNEFIQNGSRNFRFIPIIFPGAKKCHVPTWLQNTHVYAWPKDRDDILRRLMRVEKYNPPPIGELPTIISIPL